MLSYLFWSGSVCENRNENFFYCVLSTSSVKKWWEKMASQLRKIREFLNWRGKSGLWEALVCVNFFSTFEEEFFRGMYDYDEVWRILMKFNYYYGREEFIKWLAVLLRQMRIENVVCVVPSENIFGLPIDSMKKIVKREKKSYFHQFKDVAHPEWSLKIRMKNSWSLRNFFHGIDRWLPLEYGQMGLVELILR